MSMKLKTTDLAAQPDLLLVPAKQHMRVEWAYDDDFIKSVLARAIARFEQTNGVAINPATWEWTPTTAEFCACCQNRARVPVTPVKSFTAKLADATDVSANFTITTDSTYGVPILFMNGAYAAGMVVELVSGFDAAMPGGVLDVVLRNAAHLYEHREILIPGTEFVAPDLAVDATWWVPRA